MTPKEKAKELIDKFKDELDWLEDEYVLDLYRDIKQCALIAVENEYNAKIQAYNEMAEFCLDVASQAAIYAEKEKQQVIQEIEKL